MVALGDFMQNRILGILVTTRILKDQKLTFQHLVLINKVCRIFNSSYFCIDLIFTSQPNLVTESGVRSSLQENCDHQVTYGKFNLNVVYTP